MLAGDVVPWARAHPAVPQSQSGRLSYPKKKSFPGGECRRNPSLAAKTTMRLGSLTSAFRPASTACTIRWCRHTDAHIYQHTPFSFADSGVLRVTLLNFSPSFPLSHSSSILAGAACTSPTSHYPLAVSPLLSPFQPLAVIPTPLCSPSLSPTLSLCSFWLVKLLTSNPSFFLLHLNCFTISPHPPPPQTYTPPPAVEAVGLSQQLGPL